PASRRRRAEGVQPHQGRRVIREVRLAAAPLRDINGRAPITEPLEYSGPQAARRTGALQLRGHRREQRLLLTREGATPNDHEDAQDKKPRSTPHPHCILSQDLPARVVIPSVAI